MKLFYHAFYTFFVILEIILLAYVVLSILPLNNNIRKKITDIINPLLAPVRYLLKNSVFNSNAVDLSPIISFIIVTFLQNFFSALI